MIYLNIERFVYVMRIAYAWCWSNETKRSEANQINGNIRWPANLNIYQNLFDCYSRDHMIWIAHPVAIIGNFHSVFLELIQIKRLFSKLKLAKNYFDIASSSPNSLSVSLVESVISNEIVILIHQLKMCLINSVRTWWMGGFCWQLSTKL